MRYMNDQLDQIKKNHTWKMVLRLVENNNIRTKWVFQNKMNEDGQVTRNKERVVYEGYSKVEEINFI